MPRHTFYQGGFLWLSLIHIYVEIPSDMFRSIVREAAEKVGTLEKLMSGMDPSSGCEMRLLTQMKDGRFAFFAIPERMNGLRAVSYTHLLERKVNTTYPSHIQQYQRQIEQIRQDITLLEQSKAGDFSIMLDGKQYTERPAAGDAFALLYRTINENHAKDDFEFEIGSYRGFRLCLNLHPLSRCV